MPSYELNKRNLSTILPKLNNRTSVVFHHMDGCIHCQMFMPVWKQVCNNYKDRQDAFLLGVEYGMMSSLPTGMQNVQGFPTLRVYTDGKPIAEFNDNRTYDAVIDFIQKYGTKDVSRKETSSSMGRSTSRSSVQQKKETNGGSTKKSGRRIKKKTV